MFQNRRLGRIAVWAVVLCFGLTVALAVVATVGLATIQWLAAEVLPSMN